MFIEGKILNGIFYINILKHTYLRTTKIFYINIHKQTYLRTTIGPVNTLVDLQQIQKLGIRIN